MSWYYAEANERRGPVDEADFRQLIAAGTIKPETLVWSDGMEKWTAYGKLPSTTSPAMSTGTAVATLPTGPGEERCGECGQVFPTDEMITYEGRAICANCKPLFFQKIREGAATGEREYASVWIRFAAKFLDAVILNIVGQLVGLVVLPAFGNTMTATYVNVALGMLIGASYGIFFLGKYGATPGKMACKLQVVRADGAPLTFGRATGRYFAEILSGMTLGIGYIMAAFDLEKRALHDRICDTRVLKKR